VSIAEPNSEFLSEFLEDYFVECDEHLTVIRRNLLIFERSVNKPRVDGSVLNDLFRSFHTLKGISGMVGLRPAEQLAHQMESYLRSLRDSDRILTQEGMEALIAGTKLIEQVIAEHRLQVLGTDIGPVMTQLREVTGSDGSAPVTESESKEKSDPVSPVISESTSLKREQDDKLASAVASGRKLWRFSFIPSPQLAERGINVNFVRSRLQEIGDLVHAEPQVLPQSGIAFEFIVATDEDEAKFAGWGDEGISHTLYEPPLAPGPQSYEPSEPKTVTLAPSNIVRVDLSRIDELMRMVGDLVITRSHLDNRLHSLESGMPAPDWRPLQDVNLKMEKQLRDLREGVMRVRMVPIGEIFERMKFVIRDLAREYDKKVNLELIGQKTEIDKLLVERMMDPILHLVRNAISHGLESTDERIANGKPPEGKISLRAFAAAENVVIEIEDDGRGLEAEKIVRRAQASNLIGDVTPVDNASLLELICAPGLSTREEADRASGRGMGMNVVKNTISALGGSFELETEQGRRTCFRIQLPLTLAIANALVVLVCGRRYAVLQSSVREVIEIEPSAIRVLENNEIIPYHGGVLPLLRLARYFGLDQGENKGLRAFVVGSGSNTIGVVVDRILGQKEIVVRGTADPLIQVPGIAGATELGDGRIVLILDSAVFAASTKKLNGSAL
jgi:two-component system chemotaxis sensor kinase CheA